jgi:hypothetical protein
VEQRYSLLSLLHEVLILKNMGNEKAGEQEQRARISYSRFDSLKLQRKLCKSYEVTKVVELI